MSTSPTCTPLHLCFSNSLPVLSTRPSNGPPLCPVRSRPLARPLPRSASPCSLLAQASASPASSTSRYLDSLSGPRPASTLVHTVRLGPLTFRLSSTLILLIVPCIWSSFVVCAKFLHIMPVSLSMEAFNSLRLLLSSLIYAPIVLPALLAIRSDPTRRAVSKYAVSLGLLMFMSNMIQIVGLQYTTASRAAFLNQTSTVLVPLSAAALRYEPLTLRIALGAVCAIFGIAFLTAPATAAAAASASSPVFWTSVLGDVLELVAAAFTSAYVIYTSRVTRLIPDGLYSELAGVKVWAQALMAFVWMAATSLFRRVFTATAPSASVSSVTTAAVTTAATAATAWTPVAVLLNVLLVLWTGIVVSALTAWLQTRGQAGVSAGQTAVLFASQPVWASIFAAIFLRERMTMRGMFGAFMILTGAIVASTGNERRSSAPSGATVAGKASSAAAS